MPRTKEKFEEMRRTTQQKITSAALTLFARKGLSVTVSEIAKASGLSQGLLYQHYPSKDALIAELVRQAESISSQSVIHLTSGEASAADKIKLVSNMMCRMFTETPQGIEFFMFMVQVGMSDTELYKTEIYTPEFPNPAESFAAVIAQGQAEGSAVAGDPMQLSLLYWSAVQGLCAYTAAGVLVTPEERMLNRIILKEDYI
jgi:AcrR family transcriptional regulator